MGQHDTYHGIDGNADRNHLAFITNCQISYRFNNYPVHRTNGVTKNLKHNDGLKLRNASELSLVARKSDIYSYLNCIFVECPIRNS